MNADSATNIDAMVQAGLPALGLPADAATAAGVATHLGRLSVMAALVMSVPTADEVETPSRFEP